MQEQQTINTRDDGREATRVRLCEAPPQVLDRMIAYLEEKDRCVNYRA